MDTTSQHCTLSAVSHQGRKANNLVLLLFWVTLWKLLSALLAVAVSCCGSGDQRALGTTSRHPFLQSLTLQVMDFASPFSLQQSQMIFGQNM